MGRAKEELIKAQERGYLYPRQRKSICSEHFNDEAINQYILRNSFPGTCDFCGLESGKKSVLDLNDFLDYLSRCITRYYNLADNELPYETAEGGYQGTFYLIDEILRDVLSVDTPLDPSVMDEILSYFDDTPWCKRGYFAPDEGDIKRYDWEEFKKVVKHQARYFFHQTQKEEKEDQRTVDEILIDIFKSIKDYNLITVLDETYTIYRTRQHSNMDTPNSLEELGSPPKKRCKYSNRMSPSGISMFYGALDDITAKKEAMNYYNQSAEPLLTTGEFSLIHNTSVIDLRNLPELPSIFDENSIYKREDVIFLGDFVADLSKKIEKDGKEHIEYVPTQIVTEYFRFFGMDKGIKGMIYPSSLNPRGDCCVLFMNNKQCKHLLTLNKTHTEKII